MKKAILSILFLIFLLASAVAHAQVTYPPIFGIQDDKMTWDPTLRPKADEVGARWVRQYVFWNHIEPNPPSGGIPSYDWTLYDSLFLEYKNMGLTVLAVIGGIPSWAATNSYGPFHPGRMDDFKRFIRDLVERYDGDGVDDAPGSPVVNFFEFFNEPDLTSTTYAGDGWGYWSGSAPGVGGSGAGYAQMLTAVFPEVKASNPNAKVLLGGLALEHSDFFNFNFLSEVLTAGGGNYFDIMNFHYYVAFESVWRLYGKDILGKANYIRSILNGYGFQEKPFFVSESGEWSTESDACVIFFRRSEEVQAKYVPKLFVRALSDSNIKAVSWFILQDFGFDAGCDTTRGLIRANGSLKPSYYAYKTASDLLSAASFQGILANADGYEGYEFLGSEGKRIYALWNESGDLPISLDIPSRQVLRVDKLGNQEAISPAFGNQYNLTIGPDPIYLLIDPPSIYVEQNGFCGGKTICVTPPSVQNGIDSAQPFAIVEVSQETYSENIILDDSKELMIRGGWDVAFTANPSFTVINGSLTIGHGTLIILGGVKVQ